MALQDEIEAQIALLEARLVILNGAPVDIYTLGTVVRFAANSNTKQWHYKKDGDVSWISLETPGLSKPLNEWVLDARESPIGYFEIYVLTVAETPIYTSS